MRFTMSLNFRLMCYEWQGLTASVLPDRRRRRPDSDGETGNGDADGKVNDKSTLSQAVQGADTNQEEGNGEEEEDPGARPRTRQLGEAEGRGAGR